MKTALLALLLAVSSVQAQTRHPFTFEDMMKLKRIGGFAPSPDGKWVVFDSVDVDLEANTTTSHLWIVPASGGDARRLNQTPNHEERPRFSPDGKRFIWTSKATDPTQIWICNFTPESGGLDGQPHQLTSISTGADGGIWSPDGENIVFLSSVYPEAKTDAENKQRNDKIAQDKVKAKIFTRLLFRHWNAYGENKRSHLFVVSADGPNAEPRDLTPGDHDVPPFNLGGQDMYAVSPDGQELAYTRNIDEVEATSTNNEIFVVPINVGQVSNLPGAGSQVENLRHVEPKEISTSPGSDSTPLYSPDSKYIAWRSMARAGYEADKQALIIYDRATGKLQNLTANLDRSVGSFTWTVTPPPQEKPIRPLVFSAENSGESPLWLVNVGSDEPPAKIGGQLHADDLAFVPTGGADVGTLFFTNQSSRAPTEIWSIKFPGEQNPAPVTHMNDALLSQIEMQPMESFTFKGAENADVQGFLIKPPGFDPTKKYPLKFLITAGRRAHGGIRGAIGGIRNSSRPTAMSWS